MRGMEVYESIQHAWAALRLVRLAIEETCPAGVLPLCGPELVPEGDALAKAIIETVERLNRCHSNTSVVGRKVGEAR